MAAILPRSGSDCPAFRGRTGSVGPVTRRLLGLLLAVLLVGSACGDTKDASQQTTGPYAVGVRTVTFVDNSRALDPRNKQPDAPRRRLVTNLWYPAEGAPSDTEVADTPSRPRGRSRSSSSATVGAASPSSTRPPSGSGPVPDTWWPESGIR